MNDPMRLETLLPASGRTTEQQAALFGVLNLGLIDSMANGLLGATDAVRLFYNADNGHFVRQRLRSKVADEIMGRGTQLPDLFDAMPAEEAHREFQHELSAMRVLCWKLLEQKRLVA